MLKDENRLDESYDLLKRAGRLRPQDISVLYGLGSLHLAADRVEEAQKALEVVTREAPTMPRATCCSPRSTTGRRGRPAAIEEAKVVEMLKEKRQAQQPGSSGDLGPAYRGEELPPRRRRRPRSVDQEATPAAERPTVMR